MKKKFIYFLSGMLISLVSVSAFFYSEKKPIENNLFKTSGQKEFASSSFSSNPSNSKTVSLSSAVASLSEEQDAKRAVIKNAIDSVVNIDITKIVKIKRNNPFDFFFSSPNQNSNNYQEYEDKGIGSGFIVKRVKNTYYVLTNYHVAGDVDKMVVTLNNKDEYEAKFVGGDKKRDIAVISFHSDKSLKVLELANSDDVMVGDTVFVIGSPLGLQFTVTSGIISALNRRISQAGTGAYIQTDASINRGNSGGPLINIKGQVIGMNTLILSHSGDNAGLGFAIPSNNINSILDTLIKNGAVDYGWLGIKTGQADKNILSQLGYKQSQEGAFVYDVVKDSPAVNSGIRPGDIIVKIEDIDIKNSYELVSNVANLLAGKKYKFSVLRNKKPLVIDVKIEKRTKKDDKKDSIPGFYVSTIDKNTKEYLHNRYNISMEEGDIVISGIEKDSAAMLSGLQNLDKLLQINDKPIKNIADFYNILQQDINKNQMKITIQRQGRKFSLILSI